MSPTMTTKNTARREMEAYRAMSVLDWPRVTREVDKAAKDVDRLVSSAASLESEVAHSQGGSIMQWPVLSMLNNTERDQLSLHQWPVLSTLNHAERDQLFTHVQRALHASTALSGVLMARSALSNEVATREVYENVCATLDDHYRELRAATQHVCHHLTRVVTLPGPSSSEREQALFRDVALAWGSALYTVSDVCCALDKAEGVYLDYGEYLNSVTNNVRSA